MKHNTFLLNVLLTGVLGLILLAWVLVRTFLPGIVLPGLDIPGLTLLSLTALLVEHALAPGQRRQYLWIFSFSAATFGLLPLAAGAAGEWGKLALTGGIVFTAVTWLFTAALNRISSGKRAKAAPFITALGIYLAAQGFAGMLL